MDGPGFDAVARAVARAVDRRAALAALAGALAAGVVPSRDAAEAGCTDCDDAKKWRKECSSLSNRYTLIQAGICARVFPPTVDYIQFLACMEQCQGCNSRLAAGCATGAEYEDAAYFALTCMRNGCTPS